MRRSFNYYTLVLLLLTAPLFAQQKYWVIFKDKEVANYDYTKALSPKTIENRRKFQLPLYQYSDVPVSLNYIRQIQNIDIQTVHVSKWLNAVSCYMGEKDQKRVAALPFVRSVESIAPNIVLTSANMEVETRSYSVALTQMQSNLFLEEGITGEGVAIGVIDAGFYKANADRFLEHLFSEFKIMGQRDFLDPKRKDIITEQATDSDGHGRRVLDMITGYSKDEKLQVGMAVNSRFYLARTENGAREYRGEEDTWIAALEWMDSIGVRLISTSLGYAVNMDDPADNYKTEEMNGKTAKISKAAQMAVDEKGIFLVVSAGNEGNNPRWRIVSAPADAQGVLSVGATRDNTWDKIGYSSIGPEFLPYLKPNLSCFSPDGTSFSAPAIAGFVACLMQKAPNLSNKQLKELIEKSSHLYPYGNNYIGYGVPQVSRALALIANPAHHFTNTQEKNVTGKKITLKFNDKVSRNAIVFHKKNETIVVSQSEATINKTTLGKPFQFLTFLFPTRKLRLVRKPDIARSTVAVGDSVIEIIWK